MLTLTGPRRHNPLGTCQDFVKAGQLQIDIGPDVWLEGSLEQSDTSAGENLTRTSPSCCLAVAHLAGEAEEIVDNAVRVYFLNWSVCLWS